MSTFMVPCFTANNLIRITVCSFVFSLKWSWNLVLLNYLFFFFIFF